MMAILAMSGTAMAELSIYETLIEAGIPHYTGADSFAANGAFVGYGVDYELLGKETAEALGINYSGFEEAATQIVEVITSEDME